MCLLDILYKIASQKQLKLVACHYNHNWRGEAAKQEQENCRKFCEEKNISFYTETAPDDIKKNETEARELRYEFFERAMNKFNTDVFFTAHNYDDNAETLIYRIAKGTGINGLKGILPKRDKYYRPLLSVKRCDIENYCIVNGLTPNQDSSNDDKIHKRNLIRHDILPLLEKINPDIKKSLNSLAAVAISENKIIDEYISKLSENIYKDNIIQTQAFIKLSQPLKQKIIYNLIYESEFDYNMDTVKNICEFIENVVKENKTSKFSLGKNGFLYADNNIINIIRPSEKCDKIIRLDNKEDYNLGKIKFKIQPANKYLQTDSENEAYVDLSEFKELYIRTRHDGDIIQPLGSEGKMKLKKYLMSKKIPQYLRDNLLLLTDGNEILWVGGVGLSEKIKVKNNPTHKLSIEL